jgi:hypothetical protein
MTEVLDRPADTSGDDDARRQRRQELRAQYRTLQDMEARQRAIVEELARIDTIAEPTEDDLTWQGTASRSMTTWTSRPGPTPASPWKGTGRAARPWAPAEEPAGDRSWGELVATPARRLDRVRANLVEPRTVRGGALDAIEQRPRGAAVVGRGGPRPDREPVPGRRRREASEPGPDAYRGVPRGLHDPAGESRRTTVLTVQGGGFSHLCLNPSITPQMPSATLGVERRNVRDHDQRGTAMNWQRA